MPVFIIALLPLDCFPHYIYFIMKQSLIGVSGSMCSLRLGKSFTKQKKNARNCNNEEDQHNHGNLKLLY